jgi:hypothetical protein
MREGESGLRHSEEGSSWVSKKSLRAKEEFAEMDIFWFGSNRLFSLNLLLSHSLCFFLSF